MRTAHRRLTVQRDAPPWADVRYAGGDLLVIKNEPTQNVEVTVVERDVVWDGRTFEVASLDLRAVVQAG